jgi:hypothetical protein
MEATMPAGRPTKYDPAHCEVAEATLGEGFSEAVLAGRLGVCLTTITSWKNEHPEFLASVKRGSALGAQVWEQRLHTLAASGEGNATAIIFGLKNRVPSLWRDKTEQDVNATHNVRTITHRIVRPEPRGD